MSVLDKKTADKIEGLIEEINKIVSDVDDDTKDAVLVAVIVNVLSGLDLSTALGILELSKAYLLKSD